MSDLEVSAAPPEAAAPPAGDVPATPAPEAPAADGTAKPEGDTPTGETKPATQRTFTQEDFDRVVTRERAKAERRAERLGYERAMREAAERQIQQRTAPEPEAPARAAGRPTPDQFKDWDAYNEAVIKHEVATTLKAEREAASRARAEAEEAKKAETVRASLAKGLEKYEDFEEVALSHFPVTQTMGETMLDLGDVGNDVLYFLGSNHAEASRIANLSLRQQVLAIEKIAEQLKAPPKPTTAPAPIRPNAGTGGMTYTVDNAPDYATWVKARNRQLGRTA
jgi:hypothetical protein